MRRVLVTHADSAVGRRVIRALYRDPDTALVLATGAGPEPSFLEPYRDRCAYQQVDLARARHLSSLFRSERWARARVDSVLHLPTTGERDPSPIPGRVPARVSETRRLLEACREYADIERFVYLSSAFVYQPEPGSSNVVSEDSALGFEAPADAALRALVDADLICQGELKGAQLRMTILRAAAIVGEGGELVNAPPLEGGATPLGFDPLVSVIALADVARALLLALHADAPGIYNVAGREVFPRSQLVPPATALGPLPLPVALPGALAGAVALARGWLGGRTGGFERYGVVLSSARAAERLGFEPLYRLELRDVDGVPRLEPVRRRA